MHILIKIAKEAIEYYVKHKSILSPSLDISLPSEVPDKAGVFVSIKKKEQLRGCIGTYSPQTENVIMETILNAISAATRDPRFPPVNEPELNDLTYSVDVLSGLEKVDTKDDLDPKHYGVVIIKGSQRGLLLPDLEGVETVDEQLRIAKLKAGISVSDNEDIELYRFKVLRYR
jgi:AmmeMemoRadiSam system protein A